MSLKIHGIGETFNVNQVIGKNLIAAVNVNVRSTANISSKSNILYVAKAGEIVGNVYSYVYGKGADAAKVFWMLDKDESHGYRFVLHTATSFRYGNLQDQGAKTTKEQTEEQKKKDAENSGNWWDKLGLNADTLKKGALIVGGILALKLLFNSSGKNQ